MKHSPESLEILLVEDNPNDAELVIRALRRIRTDDRTKQVPVVILTSSNEVRDIVMAYQLGANSFIVKPVEFESFLDVISETGLYWLKTNVISDG